MDTEQDLMESNNREAPLHHRVEEMETDKPECVLHLKVERETEILINSVDIKSESLMDGEVVVKQEVDVINIKQEDFEDQIYVKNYAVGTEKCSLAAQPFQCKICQRTFTKKRNLKRHLSTHTGVNPFKWDISQQRFNFNSHLREHLRTHTEKKSFESEICKEECNLKGHLNSELSMYTEKNPEYNICQQGFTLPTMEPNTNIVPEPAPEELLEPELIPSTVASESACRSDPPIPGGVVASSSRLEAASAEETDAVNYGSENDSSDEEASSGPVFLPRPQRPYLQELEDAEPSIQALESELSSASQPTTTAQGSSNSESSSCYGPSLFEFNWRAFPNPPVHLNTRKEKFSESTCGPTTPLLSPYEAFVAIWDRDFMKYIAAETNRYAQELTERKYQEGGLHQFSRIAQWQDTDADELYVYFGLLLAMAECVKSDLQEYWTKKTILVKPMLSYMSYNRFLLLSRCLHFNHTDTDLRTLTRPEAKLFKIAPVVQHLNRKFQTLYSLHRNIAVDESLAQWKGCLNIKQDIKNKLATVGIKTYEVWEVQTGYLWRFKVHAGRETERSEGEVTPASGVIETLVLDLLKGLENKGHTVWMDDYYNSPSLARLLKCLGFDCVGTLRTDRPGVPPHIAHLKKCDMRVGQISGCTSGDVDVLVWRGKSRVAMVSTYHGTNGHTPRRTRRKNPVAVLSLRCTKRRKPAAVLDYNICISGLNRKDQMLSMHSIERKHTQVWYKKFFKRLLNVSVLNAYILHSESAVVHSHSVAYRVFRKELITQLLDKHSTRQPVPVLVPAGNTSRFLPPESLRHFLEEYGVMTNTTGNEKMRSCVECSRPVPTFCPACGVPLCAVGCSRLYHTQGLAEV